MEKVRYALIGYGAWGRYHARAIQQAENSELSLVCARSEESRKSAQTDWNVAVTANYKEAVTRDDIDVVDIVLPNYLHHEVALAALNAGKHLTLEKPMAISVQQCREILDAAERNERQLSVGFEMRVSSLWGELNNIISSGKIGRPVYGSIDLWRRPYRLGSEGWRFDKDRVGSWILEEPVHFFDLARWYMASVGDPVSVFACESPTNTDTPELIDNFACLISFPDQAFVSITHTLSAYEHHQTAKFAGTEGSVWAQWSGVMDRTEQPSFSLHWSDGQEKHEVKIQETPGEVFELMTEIETFSNTVLSDAKPIADGLDGLWAVHICLAAEESARQGKPVSLAL